MFLEEFMEVYNYKTKGVCSSNIKLVIQDDKLVDIEVTGGCNGNLKGIRSLIIGMKLNEIKEKLSGIKCGFKETSCPEQIASAIREYQGELVK